MKNQTFHRDFRYLHVNNKGKIIALLITLFIKWIKTPFIAAIIRSLILYIY